MYCYCMQSTLLGIDKELEMTQTRPSAVKAFIRGERDIRMHRVIGVGA